MLLWICMYKYFFKFLLTIHLGIYPAVKSLEPIAIVFNILRNHYTVWQPGCTIYNPITDAQEWQFLHIFANTYFFLFVLIVAFIMVVRSYLLVVLICISLMISDNEHLFMYLFGHLYLEKFLFKCFAIFKIVLFVCSWVGGVNHIFWILIPYQIYDLQIFSHSVNYLFTLKVIDCVLWYTKGSHFHLVYFYSCCLWLSCHIQVIIEMSNIKNILCYIFF